VSGRFPAACVAAALAGGAASAAPPDPNAAYKKLVATYAAGHRAAAVAGIGALDDDALRAGVESVRYHPPRYLLAVLLLHTDRRLLGRSVDVEAPQGCRSAHTDPARRTAEHLILHVDGIELARRWTIAMALRDQWDGCFPEAVAWIDAGARWFAGDAEVALTRGAIYETLAMLPSRAPTPYAAAAGRARTIGMVALAERKRMLGEARRSLERAVALDPGLDRARVRLARVLWHLGKGAESTPLLEAAIAGSREEDVHHLAHLVLARVRQEAGRHEDAIPEYRAALAVQPDSQAAALGLADALRASGQVEAAREVVEAVLAASGRRRDRQFFWEYRTADARRGEALLDALRDELGP
jgi:tetratricopeptide (TPR) repeat protein